MAVAAAVDWTGFYIGAHVGGAWGSLESYNDSEITSSHDMNGFIGGGQIGYNFQTGPVVFGLEGEGSFLDYKGAGECSGFFDLRCSTKADWLATATARLGFTADKALIYVKGGGAWSNMKSKISFDNGDDWFSGDKDRVGWVVGTGVEYAITQNWSAKIEYNYIDFGKDGVTFDNVGGPGPDSIDRDIKQSMHTVKFGINYRFGEAPISARY